MVLSEGVVRQFENRFLEGPFGTVIAKGLVHSG